MTFIPQYAVLELGAVIATGEWTPMCDLARARKESLRPEYKHQVTVVRLQQVAWQ